MGAYKQFIYFGICCAMLMIGSNSIAQEMQISGVHQGKSLYIQNPLLKGKQQFCISEIMVNHKKLDINYLVSAFELKFENIDLFTPITIKIVHHPECQPTILNPEAIRFHSAFGFREIVLTDTSLTWKTKGEKITSTYEIEKLYANGWEPVEQIASQGLFSGSEYALPIELTEGPNKFRIKYSQLEPARSLFSDELEFVFYPEPITVHPYTVTENLYISRVVEYEISTGEGVVILTGKGKVVKLKTLRRGEYFITIGEQVEKFQKI